MPFAEGASINRPPMFGGVNYAFWKIFPMKIFMESIDMAMGSSRSFIISFGIVRFSLLLRFWPGGCWKTRLLLKLIWLGEGWWLTILFAACAEY